MSESNVRKLIEDLRERRTAIKIAVHGAYGVYSHDESRLDKFIANNAWKNMGKLEMIEEVIIRLGEIVGEKITFDKLGWDL